MDFLKKHWGLLLGILFVCCVAYADSIGSFNGVRLKPGTLPTVGKDGELRVDSADDNKLKKYNESTVAWEEITGGGGSGAGGVTYFADFDADTISNLVEFDDTAVGGDLTGGSAANLSQTSNTTTPINGTASYRISKSGADASFEGVHIAIDQDDLLFVSGKPFIFSFNYDTSANYNASTEAVSIYYYRVGTDSAAQACNGRTLSGSVSNTLGVATSVQQFSCSFNLASTTTAVRIAWVVTGTGTSTWDLDIDNIYFGPDFQVPGVIVTPWETTTCTGSLATNVSYACRTRRIDDTLYVKADLTFSGATDNVNVTLTVPNSLTVDTSKLASGTFSNIQELGYGNFLDSGTLVYQLAIGYLSTTTVNLYYYNSSSNAANQMTGQLPVTTASGDRISVEYSVPILQFANQSASLSTTQVDLTRVKVVAKTASVPTASPSLANTTNSNIIYGTEVTDTHNAYNSSTGVFTAPESGFYDISGTTHLSGTYASAGVTEISIEVDGAIVKSSSTYINAGSSTFQSAFVSLNGYYLNKGQTVNIAVVPLNWSSISFVSDASRHWLEIKTSPDLSTFGVYGLYEYTEAEITSSTDTTAADTLTAVTGSAITLSPGTWDLCYSVLLKQRDNSAATNTVVGSIAFYDASNVILAATQMGFGGSIAASFEARYPVSHCAEVTVTTSITYDLGLLCSDASANGVCGVTSQNYTALLTGEDTYSKVYARRMK